VCAVDEPLLGPSGRSFEARILITRGVSVIEELRAWKDRVQEIFEEV
jgi:hypothetical protein